MRLSPTGRSTIGAIPTARGGRPGRSRTPSGCAATRTRRRRARLRHTRCARSRCSGAADLDARDVSLRVDDQPVDRRLGEDREVGAIEDRRDEGAVRAVPPAVPDRRAVPADAVERPRVEERVGREAGLLRGRRKTSESGLWSSRTAGTSTRLHVLEGLQHVRPVPARAAGRGPGVVVAARSAQVDHPVDRARSAEHAAAGQAMDAALRARLRRSTRNPSRRRCPRA